ncbi:MAG: response regulator transcription factor [Deltaproteobacteria bacterium]|nr:response regulator transcription factor [Deltaproteobacteria bacterium]
MSTETVKRVLVIEDEPDMVRGLRDAMVFEGYEVTAALTGQEGISLAREGDHHLILLDLMLPDVNGYQVCEEIRSFDTFVPIIILTARGQEADKIRGLEVGADDYVTKPFSIGELLARIKAIFRRLDRTAVEAPAQLVVGAAVIDLRKHELTHNRRTVTLSFYEVELLRLLSERAHEVVSRDEILEKVWGLEASPTNRTVDNFIVKLRRKIEEDTKAPRHILTIYGQGYKLIP